jgi:putative PIN family toxin of toxin-antitoxin system
MTRSKVFLDTSTLIAALLSSKGGSFYILTQLKNFHFQINRYVLDETLEVLDDKFSDRKELKSNLFLLLGLSKTEILSNPSEHSVKDVSKYINEEDAPILASAIEKSNYLITLDKDFLDKEVKKFAEQENIIIFTPREFINFLRSQEHI